MAPRRRSLITGTERQWLVDGVNSTLKTMLISKTTVLVPDPYCSSILRAALPGELKRIQWPWNVLPRSEHVAERSQNVSGNAAAQYHLSHVINNLCT